MSNQIIGGVVAAKDVAEEIMNPETGELEARGWIRVTIERQESGALDDLDIFDGNIDEIEGPDSFTFTVQESDAAFKKLNNPLVAKGATVLMVVNSAVRNASGFETLVISKVAVDTEGKKVGFYRAPKYVEAQERVRSNRVIHRY